MEYNKTQFSKASDKKVLHKVRKHWVVLSTALLMALGGGAALTGGTTSANADANANSNNNNTNASSTNTLKSRLNASLTKGYQANQANNTPKSVNVNQVSSKALTNQASALHNRILANATNASQNRQSTTNGRQASQNNGNNNEGAVLNNRIKANVNAPNVGANYNAPNVGTNYTYNGQLPVTIAYLNSGTNNGNYHNVQYKDNGNNLIPNIQQQDVPVYGNKVNFDYNQTLQYSAPDGYKFVSTPMVNYHIGNDDGTVTYTWNKPNSVINDNHQSNDDYGTTINSDANWDKANNRPLILLEPSDTGKNIIVNYVNQNGTPLDGTWGQSTNSDTISDIDNQPISNAYGDVINVTKQGSNSHGIQNGIPQPNSTKNNYILDKSDTKVNYSVTNSQQNITIPLKGKTFAENSSSSDNRQNNVNVNIYIKNNKGQYLTSGNTWQKGSVIHNTIHNHYLHGQIGSKTLVTPDESWIKGSIPNASRYSDDPNDTNQYINFKGDISDGGTGTGLASISDSSINGFSDKNNSNTYHTINFTYDTNATDTADEKAAGFSVKYIDQAGNVIGPNGFMNSSSDAASYSDNTVHGKYGDSINVLNTDSTDNNGITGVQPEGYNAGNPSAGTYSLDPDQDVNYTINSDNYGNNDEQKNTQYYYFTGNQVATNANGKYPLKVQMNATYYQTPSQSNGYSVNTLDTTKGNDGLVTKLDSNVNVSDLVGNTHVLNASNFINEIPHKVPHKGSGQVYDQVYDQVQPNSKNNGHKDDNDSDVTSANLRFNPNGKLDVTKPSNDNRTLNYDTRTNTLTFNYDVYEDVNQTAQHKIYVHYVTPSDPTSDITTVYNSDGSKTNVAGKTSYKPDGTPITIANTTVSDSGYSGEPFNNNAVEESDTGSLNNGSNSNKGGNVPRGYQFVKVLGSNPIYATSDDHTLSYHFSGWQGNHANGKPISLFSGNDQNEVIEVVPKVQGVTVNYVDQKGKTQKTIVISGNDAHGISRYGKTIDLAGDSTDQATNAVTGKPDSIAVPQGYHIADNNSDAGVNSDSKVETTDYLFNTPGKASLHGNVYNVMIAGNNEQDSASDVATIHIHEENPAGKVVHSYDVNDNINGDVNDPYTINAANFTPDGYVENPANQSAKGTILPNGLSNRDINFYYKLNSTINYQQLSDIFVTYYHNGKQIGMNTITPRNGDYDNESVNVQDRPQFAVPAGYDLIGGQNTISKFQYHQPNYLNLNVYDPNSDDSNQVYADFTLQQKLYNHSGDTQPAKTLYHIIPESGKAGSGFSISANNYQVNGYKETANSPLSGTITNNGLNPDDGTIDYVATNSSSDNGGQPSQGPSDSPNNNHGSNKPAPKNNSDIPGGHNVSPDEHIAMPIYVQYWNKGNKIGSDQRVDGYMDQTFSDISKSTNVPNGYHLAADGQRLSYTIGTKEQQVNLQVNQNSANHKDAPFTLNIDEEDSNGQNAHQVAARNLTISDDTKDEISPDDYNPDSANYNVDNSNGKDGVLTLDNQDGTIKATGDNAAASSATFYYKAINNDANLAPINVMYINQNGSQVGYHIFNTDGHSDGQKIDVNNPSNGGYLPTGYSDDTSKTPKDDYVTFGDVTQNTVVFVTGKQENEALTVKYTLYNTDGSAHPGSVSTTLQNDVGNVIPYSASQALAAIESAGSGYQVDPNDPDDQTKYIHFNDNSIDPNVVHFNFYQTRQNPLPDAAGNLYINFVTRDGHVVGHGTIYGKAQGTYVSDIAQSSQGGVNPPSGYHVDTTVYPKYPHDNALKYTFKGTQNNKASVVVDPNTANSYTLTVNRIMIDNNGHHSHDTWPNGYNIKLGNGDVTHIDPSLFTPTGYHVDPDDGSATVTGTSNGLSPNAVTFVYDQNKINDASDMIVRYFNQRGQFVKEDRISGVDNFGKPIDVLDQNNDDANITGLPAGIGLPAHYSLAETGPNSNPNQRTHYVFDGSQHVINLNVQGEKLTAPLTVHIHENGGTDSVISGTISSNDGSDFLISPNGSLRGQNFTPQGYHATYSDQPQNVQMGTDGNGNGKLTPSSITFNYDADNQQAAPLTVIYLNQAGSKVGYSDVINGTLDEKINDVRDPADGGEPIPAGYQPASDQVWSYHLTSKPQTVYLHVIGNHITSNENHLMIYRIMHNANGSLTEDHIDHHLDANSDTIGDHTLIDPSASGIEPAGYHTSSSDHPSMVQVNSDGSLTPNQITFNYYAGDQAHAGIIWVHYINQNHRQVGATKEFTNSVGRPLDSSTISSEDHVPFGYTVDSGQPSSYVYKNAPQNININVSGDQVTNKPFTIYVVERDQSGKFINATPHTLKYTGRVGDTLTVSPYDTINSNGQLNGAGGTSLTPSDSHADSSDQPVTVHINANHDFVPQNSATFAYTKNSLAQSIGQITVHYGTDSNPNDSNPHEGNGTWTDVDSVTDHGIVGSSKFILNPYEDDVPDEINDSYAIANNGNGVMGNGQSVTGYKNDNQNIYIRVVKVN